MRVWRNRQLFLHHYLPALYFAIMAGSQIFDFIFSRIALPLSAAASSSATRKSPAKVFSLKDKPWIARTAVTLLLASCIGVFALYAPLAYGNSWTKAECRRVKLFDTWDWDCNTFFESYAEYSLAVPSGGSGAATATGEFPFVLFLKSLGFLPSVLLVFIPSSFPRPSCPTIPCITTNTGFKKNQAKPPTALPPPSPRTRRRKYSSPLDNKTTSPRATRSLA